MQQRPVAPWRATTLRGPHWADTTQVGRILPRELGIRDAQEIIRCLKRFLAREIFQRVMADYRARQAADVAA